MIIQNKTENEINLYICYILLYCTSTFNSFYSIFLKLRKSAKENRTIFVFGTINLWFIAFINQFAALTFIKYYKL